MRLSVGVALGYLVGSIPIARLWRREASAAAVADVAKGAVPALIVARLLGWGPYEAAACVIATAAGHLWPPAGRERSDAWALCPLAALAAVVPFEAGLSLFVIAAVHAVRRTVSAWAVALVLVPVVAVLRGQPWPYRVAAWTVAGLAVAHVLSGARAEVRAGAPVARVVVRRVLRPAGHPAP